MMISRFKQNAMWVALLMALSGCGDGGIEEVRHWMAELKQNTKVQVPKLSEPKKFAPFAYAGKNSIDPYSPSKLAMAFAKTQSGTADSKKPDHDRRREPLEAYPMDALIMVGTLQKPGLNYALILADKTVYQVKMGNYIGQNFGMITNITETEVELKEIVQDASGEWVERKAKLELQETKK